MISYIQSAKMACMQKLGGGILWLLPDILLKICTLIALSFLWRGVMSAGAAVEMTMRQMLTYTWLSTLLTDLMVVNTPATGWLSEGVLMRYHGRPLTVLGQLAAETVGGWAPMLLLFSLPMALAAPLLGISLRPASMWFFPSLALCVSLGFAIDILFACLTIKVRNVSWLIQRVRMALMALLSGTVIPLTLLPLGLDRLLRYQPFAYLGGAPLSIFVGSAPPAELLPAQLAWNLLLWAAALAAYRKSQEGMVSYGG